ncbi:zinc finger BED domain-containing protein 1-like isoform X1 [Centruroides sculpturatus]|uniref:zinc finger BED domain-containing protein 1-like isoform X1 n=1 Tax=Centruroides sculpturatus TaxID=218467 RepID=UPI000C6DD628|nr:zinc finger BED domain-containing protein 1-like isoform X1 [Centruroides sculpturatus]
MEMGDNPEVIVDNFIKLIKREKKASVWKHFVFIEAGGNFVKCIHCETNLKFCNNTTNLRNHLKCKHREIFDDMVSSDRNCGYVSQVFPSSSGESNDPSEKNINLSVSDISLKFKTPEKINSQQQYIQSSVSASIKYEKTHPQQNKLVDSLVQYLCKGIHPLKTVEEPGFIKFVTLLDPKFNIPTSEELTANVIPTMYYNIKRKIFFELKKVENVCLTIDLWKNGDDQYLGVICHFINEDWILKNYLLDMLEVPPPHNSDSFQIVLNNILVDWELQEKVNVVVSENNENCNKAITELGFLHIPCFGHILNHAIERGLNAGIDTVLKKCTKLIEFFSQSSKAKNILEQKQNLLNLPVNKLSLKAEINFNSIYSIIKQILEQQQAICATLVELNEHLLLSKDELIVLKHIKELLEPFISIIEDATFQKYMNISTLKPTIYQLRQHLTTNVENEHCTIKKVKAAMLDYLSEQYQGKCQSFLLRSSFLDPSLKSLPFLDNEKMKLLFSEVKEEMAKIQIVEESSESRNSNDILFKPPNKKLKGSLKLLCSLYGDYQEHQTSKDKISNELNQYIASASIPLGTDALQYWERNVTIFPTLAVLAKISLCVPAISVPSERLFTNEGFIINCKRCLLNPNNVNLLSCLNYNLNNN